MDPTCRFCLGDAPLGMDAVLETHLRNCAECQEQTFVMDRRLRTSLLIG